MAGITPEILVFFLTFSVLLTFLALMLGAWGWALSRIWRGVPLLAGVKPLPVRQAGWGALTVLAVFFLYLTVQILVFGLYATVTGRHPPRAVAHADPRDDTGKPGKAAHENPADHAPVVPGKVAAEQSQAEYMLQHAVFITILVVLLPKVLRLTSGATLVDLGIDMTGWKRQIGWGVGAAMLVIPAVIAIQGLAVRVWPSQKHPVELMMLEQFTPAVALLAILSTVVLAPVIEEMLFRGIIQRWLTRMFGEHASPSPVISRDEDPLSADDLASAWPSSDSGDPPVPEDRSASEQGEALARHQGSAAGSKVAIIITSLLFAAMHVSQWPAPIAIFLLSLGLGSIYQRTGSLLAAIAMHGTFNGFNTTLMLMEAIHHQIQTHGPAAHQTLDALGFLFDFAF